MKIFRACTTISFTFVLAFSTIAQDAPERVSLVQLIATPEKFDGKIVMITGFAHLQFEGNAIYLHKDDYQYGLHKNGLWLNSNKCRSRDGKNFTDGYALVIGRFTSAFQGHMNLWSGAIKDVKSCQSWPPLPRGT
jgi:hypothetical protein